ncbi:glycosyltransferase family 4 protein [Methanofollis fontis]|uniref:Glycosyltransferase family 1 protein n=1 Tax=Methanofollis fontis TaxID=2052832 RepID=A0A483CUQ3_9EURY|nr:glycosyltransferase family 4 protein [Methanofollis fontis]TAJ45177.1 hypothetical protein CUJ86_00015 [Methanofollis fontis]
MRILQFAPYYLPYLGGQERYIHNLTMHLIKRGHEVDIITSDYPKCEKGDNAAVQVHRCSCICRPLRNPISPEFLTLGKKIGDYDIVHTHNEHSSAAIAAAHYRKYYASPLFLTCHGRLIFGTPYMNLIEKVYSRTLGKKILGICDTIVVNGVDDRNYILSINPHFQEKIVVLHNAIDPEYFSSFSDSFDRCTDDDTLTILFVGRLIRRKGIEWLIKSMKILKKERRAGKIKCILVGEGEDELYFRKLAGDYGLKDDVIFLGAVHEEELISLYKNSDIFVLPSLSEVCPTVVLEAMYFGLPVITTDIPGIRDHFNGVSLLVPPQNEVSLADAILCLADNCELRDDLAIKGMSRVKSQYTWDRVAANYEQIYAAKLDYT